MNPLPSEAIFDKISMSAFVGTPLDMALRDCRIQSFAIVGIAMEIGIEPTVRHGADLGYIPVVVKDACSFGHREAAERSIASLELMSALRRTADAQASLQEQFDRYKFDRYKCELQDSNHVGARVPADVLVRQEPGEEEGEEEDEGDGK